MFFALRLIWRFIPLAISATALLVWLSWGQGVIDSLQSDRPTRARRELDRIEAIAARENPTFANELRTLRSQYPEQTLAAVLLAEIQPHGPKGLTILAENRHVELESTLQLAATASTFTSLNQREEFLLAHGVFIQALRSNGMADFADAYGEALPHLLDDPQARDVVRDDPTAVMVWTYVDDASLRSYYAANRHWLQEILSELILVKDALAPEEASSSTGDERDYLYDDASISTRLAWVLRAAQTFDPYPRLAVTEYNLGSAGFGLFLDDQQGQVIAEVAKELPAETLPETLEVIFANSDWVHRHLEQASPKEVAQKLLAIRNQQPLTWKKAAEVPLALRLGEDAPRDAQKVLEEYGDVQITVLLYGGYADEIEPATRAVAQYGDLGVYILQKYSEDERAAKLLSDPEIGPRLIPYLLRFGDQGIDRIEENKEWLNKTFHEDGSPKVAEWWQGVPLVGAPANLIRNWSNGYPNEWSEVGWAALDAADAALLVVTFGGTTAVKSAVTSAGKAATRRSVVSMGKTAAKRSAGTLSRSVKVSGTAVARGASRGFRIVLPAARPLLRATNALSKFTAKSLSLAKSTGRVMVRHRRIIAGSLAAVGLAVTLRYRTLPITSDAIDTAMHKLNVMMVDHVAETYQEVAHQLAAVTGVSVSSFGEFLFIVIALFLGLMTAWTGWRLAVPRGVRYV